MLNALEVRPLPATSTPAAPPGSANPPLPTEPQHVVTLAHQSAPVADGTSTTTYNLTGASAGALVTIETAFGVLTATDASSQLAGFQVLADGTGAATFAIKNPRGVGVLSGLVKATESTGEGYSLKRLS